MNETTESCPRFIELAWNLGVLVFPREKISHFNTFRSHSTFAYLEVEPFTQEEAGKDIIVENGGITEIGIEVHFTKEITLHYIKYSKLRYLFPNEKERDAAFEKLKEKLGVIE